MANYDKILENLQVLKDYLEMVSPETVDLGNFHCGTTYCSLGYAATLPHFQGQGLELFQEGGYRYVFGVKYKGIEMSHYQNHEKLDELFGVDAWHNCFTCAEDIYGKHKEIALNRLERQINSVLSAKESQSCPE